MTSGAPKSRTMTPSVTSAPTTPHSGERHPRVFPTARTMVKASTHSTTDATNAGSAATASVANVALTCSPQVSTLPMLHPYNSARVSSAPHLAGSLHHQLQLAPLVIPAEWIAHQRGGKAALRTERKILDRHIARRLVDSP